MKCPKDHTQLIHKKLHELDIHYCRECHGFLLELKANQAKQLEELIEKQCFDNQQKHQEPYLYSPTTKERMLKFNHQGVTLDYCKSSHSIWFDCSEYNTLFAKKKKSSTAKPYSSDYNTSNPLLSGLSDVASTIDLTLFFDDFDLSEAVGDFLGSLFSGIDL